MEMAPGVRAGYLAQRPPDPGSEESVLDYLLRRHPGPAVELRAMAGKVLFRDPAALRAAHASEGELRLAEVAAIFARRPDLRARLAAGGLEAVQQRTWDRALQQLAAGYERSRQGAGTTHVSQAA